MAVLKTTSPTARPGAPTESPSNTVPSSRARIAGWVTGVASAAVILPAPPALRRLQQSTNTVGTGPCWRKVPDGESGRAVILPGRGHARQRNCLADQVAERISACGTSRQLLCGVQGAASEDVAVGRPVD